MNNLIIVIIAHNEKKAVINNIQMLGNMDSNCEVIVVDNHSSDGLHEYLAENHMNFIYCDEGIEGYAKILNIVCQEFVQDYNCNLLVMRANYYATPNAINLLDEVLQDKTIGAVSPQSNGFADLPFYIDSYEKAKKYANTLQSEQDALAMHLDSEVMLLGYEAICETGAFNENLYTPDAVLKDYVDRMNQNGYSYLKSSKSVFYSTNPTDDMIYQYIHCSDKEKQQLDLQNLLHSFGDIKYRGVELYKYIEPDILVGVNQHNNLQNTARNVGIRGWTTDKIEIATEERQQEAKKIIEKLPQKDVLFLTLPLRRVFHNTFEHTAMESFISSIDENKYVNLELSYGLDETNWKIPTKNCIFFPIDAITGIYGPTVIDKQELIQFIIVNYVSPIEKTLNIQFDQNILLACVLKASFVLQQRDAFIQCYKDILEKVKPKVIIYSHGQDMNLTYMRDTARELHIPTVEIDHGVGAIGKFHKGLAYADNLIVYSKIVERLCRKNENDHVFGIGKPNAYNDINTIDNQLTVVTVISSLECEIFDYAVHLAKKLNKDKYLVIYKPHSAELWMNDEQAVYEKEIPNFMFFNGAIDIREVYERTNVAIGIRSSGIFDALPFCNIKIITVKDRAENNSIARPNEILDEVIRNGDIVQVQTEEELFNEVVSYQKGKKYRDIPNSFYNADAAERFRELVNYYINGEK